MVISGTGIKPIQPDDLAVVKKNKLRDRVRNGYRFDSISAFRNFVDKHEHVKTRERGSHKIGNKGKESWSGTNSWGEFQECLTTGHVELIDSVKKQVEKAREDLNEKYHGFTDYRFNVVGQFFDIGAVIIGEPEAWLDEYEDEELKPTVEFKVQCAYGSGVRFEDVLAGASRIMAFSSALNSMGVVTKVIAVFTSFYSNKKDSDEINYYEIVVKDFMDGVDFKKMSIIFHHSFFRRGIFRMRELQYENDLYSGYGSSLDSSQVDAVEVHSVSQIDRLEKQLFKDML